MKNTASPRRKSTAADEWDKQWEAHWSKVGMPGYELPVGGPGGEDREFLAAARTPVKEELRLKRITAEFTRAFKALYSVGPAVTVFGSARFPENHRYYQLARAVGGQAGNRAAEEGLQYLVETPRIWSRNLLAIWP